MRRMLAALPLVLAALSQPTARAADTVDPQIQAWLDQIATTYTTPLDQRTPAAARDFLVTLQNSVQVTLPDADVSQRTITEDGLTVDLTLVRPKGVAATDRLPVFMFFHGGGWVIGDFPTHERLVRDLVAGSGAEAVFVNYTRSPEAHYPVAINQAYAATKWVAEHGPEINVDGTRLAVVGNSVGGNMAAVVALMAKDKGSPSLLGQVLLWPVTDANFDTASYHQFANGLYLTRSAMQWFWNNYLPDASQRSQIYASPLQATVDQLKGLPPTLLQTDENDVLRDEGEAYGQKLAAAGVNVVSVRYDGMIHDFELLNPIADVPGVEAGVQQVADAIRVFLAPQTASH